MLTYTHDSSEVVMRLSLDIGCVVDILRSDYVSNFTNWRKPGSRNPCETIAGMRHYVYFGLERITTPNSKTG